MTVTVADGAAYDPGTPASASVTITDPPTPVATIAATDANGSEIGPDNATFTVTLAAPAPYGVNVGFTTRRHRNRGHRLRGAHRRRHDSSGTDIGDHHDRRRRRCRSRGPGDGGSDINRRRQLHRAGTPDSAAATIADQPEITLTATDPTAAELGPDTGTFTVSRYGATTTTRDVVIGLTGTAEKGLDYQLTGATIIADNFTSVTVRIPAWRSSTAVTVTPIFNAVTESAETVIATAEGSTATVTIADEPAATIVATDPNAAELGPDTGTFTVTRGGVMTFDRDVVIAMTGTAEKGLDYQLTGAAIVADNFTSVTVRIPAGARRRSR